MKLTIAKEELINLIDYGNMKKEVWDGVRTYQKEIEENWPAELKEFVMGKMGETVV